MPSTPANIFAAAELAPAGPVLWGAPVPETASGVYVVALSDEADADAGGLEGAPLGLASLERLLASRPELRLDGHRPDASALATRLAAFWLPENIVYIGRATSLRSRVRAYYRTPLGARRPHAGGWWL